MADLETIPDDPLACDTYRRSGTFSRRETRRLARRDPVFRVLYTLRWCQSARGLALRIARRAHFRACRGAGIDMPESVRIGAGLSILHGWGLVINARATIGRNVTLLHGVTIGSAARIAADGTIAMGYPTLEDGVTVGPNASIVGDVTIGEGARILPGAAVFFDVPAHAMVGGNPGKVIKEGVPEDIWNKVPFDRPDP